MKDAMSDYLKALGIEKKVIEISVLERWGELMGEAVDKRTKQKIIRDGVLHLEINSSVMRDELMQSKSEIIKKLNDEAGFELISDIFFK